MACYGETDYFILRSVRCRIQLQLLLETENGAKFLLSYKSFALSYKAEEKVYSNRYVQDVTG
jgi:hypothetical protein